MKNNILQLHNQSERTVEKIDCPFSMPMSRKERPPMTKPREKTREELQAEIEDGKKKIRQFENQEKMLRHFVPSRWLHPLAPLMRLSLVDLLAANGFDKPFAASKFED